jgi:hypothetical protein
VECPSLRNSAALVLIGVYGKTAHVLITRTGEKLTDEEREALMRLAIV